MSIAEALVSLAPGAQWTLNGEDLAGLVWLDEEVIRPDDEAILAEAARLAALPALFLVRKADIYARATEAEAEAIDAAVNAAGAKLRGLWNASLEFRSDGVHWPQIMAMAEQLFGQARAAELLAGQP